MILLVEDQPLLAMMTQCALEEAGYKVALATSGQQALEILAGGLTPAVLLTDIRLGRGLNGWQLALRAREHDRALRVIYVSGDPDQDSSERAVPGSGMLSKPLNIPRLLNAVSAEPNSLSG